MCIGLNHQFLVSFRSKYHYFDELNACVGNRWNCCSRFICIRMYRITYVHCYDSRDVESPCDKNLCEVKNSSRSFRSKSNHARRGKNLDCSTDIFFCVKRELAREWYEIFRSKKNNTAFLRASRAISWPAGVLSTALNFEAQMEPPHKELA